MVWYRSSRDRNDRRGASSSRYLRVRGPQHFKGGCWYYLQGVYPFLIALVLVGLFCSCSPNGPVASLGTDEVMVLWQE